MKNWDRIRCASCNAMLMGRRLFVASLLLVCFWWVGCGCNEKSGVSGADGAVDDASIRDSQPDAMRDSRPDAEDQHSNDGGLVDGQWPPEPVTYDFCDEPFFKLPIDGLTETSHRVQVWGSGVVYAKEPAGGNRRSSLYYLDLETCKEYQLTIEEERAGGAWLYEKRVVYRACHDFCSKDPPKGSDLFLIDLDDWSKSRVLEEDIGIIETKFNGRHVVLMEYQPGDWEPNLPPTRQVVWDMATEEKVALTPWGAGTPYYAISERYVVWSGYFGLEGQVGKDVAYYDLQTGEMVHIESTLPWHQTGVDVWEDNIVWVARENYSSPPYHTKLFNVESGVETTITENEEKHSYATIHKNIVAYSTSLLRDPSLQGNWPADLVLYEIGSGKTRRLTTESGKLNQVRIFEPYFLTVHVLGSHPNMNDYYIANLRKLGVTDEEGNLLEGEPVITPP